MSKFLTFLLFLTACSQKQQKTSVPTQATFSSAIKAEIDPKTLKVYQVRVSFRREQLKRALSLAYEPDGRAQLIEYLMCPKEGSQICPQGMMCAEGGKCFRGQTIYNRVRIPLILAGEIVYKVRACVEGPLQCGPYEEITHNSHVFDSDLASINMRIESIRHGLRKLAEEDYLTALTDFTKSATNCDAVNSEHMALINSKVRVIKQFIHAPSSWTFQVTSNIVDEILLSDETGLSSNRILKDTEKTIYGFFNELDKACQELGPGSDYVIGELTEPLGGGIDKDLGITCKLLASLVTVGKGFISVADPSLAVGTLSGALHDAVYSIKGDAGQLVPKLCTAEQNLNTRLNGINQAIEIFKSQLRELKNELNEHQGTTENPLHKWDHED